MEYGYGIIKKEQPPLKLILECSAAVHRESTRPRQAAAHKIANLELHIEKLIYGGDGLARLPADERGRGKVVFLPFVLAGERVEASLIEEKPGFARARLERILAAAPERIQSSCPYFERCGGCHYQHAAYEHQLAIKAEILRENLRRIAKLELASEVRLHPSPPWNYRNRTRLQVRSEPDFAIGYYKFGSHDLLPVEQCPVSSPLINRAIAAVWTIGRSGQSPPQIEEIEFFANAEDTELLVEFSPTQDARKRAIATNDEFPASAALDKWAEALKSQVPELAGVVCQRGGPVYGIGQLTYRTGLHAYRVSAGSFFQVNRYMTDELIAVVTGGLRGKLGLDLYAGVGLFSTLLAKSMDHIEAVESSQSSLADLQYNSPANVKAIGANVEQYLQQRDANLCPDVVVVDPPRSGLGERVAKQLGKIGARQIVYVSCDPATLGRDLKHLLASGYNLQQAHVVDLFPQTYHLETVLHLTK